MLVIIICFMAVTSSGASEMLAVSSLYTFDFYRRYINPKVTLFCSLPSSVNAAFHYTACMQRTSVLLLPRRPTASAW